MYQLKMLTCLCSFHFWERNQNRFFCLGKVVEKTLSVSKIDIEDVNLLYKCGSKLSDFLKSAA